MNPFPTRKRPQAVLQADLEDYWSRFRKSWGMGLLWQKGLSHNIADRQAAIGQVLEAIESGCDPCGWTIDETAIFLAMARTGTTNDSGVISHEMVSQLQPVEAAFCAQYRALKLGSKSKDNCSTINEEGPSHGSATCGAWMALRARLSSCSESEYQSCLTQAQETYSDGSLLEKNFLAFLFPDQDWWQEACRLTLAQAMPGYPLPSCGEVLLASVQDFDILSQLLENRGYPAPAAFAWSIAQQFGWRSTPLLLGAARQLKDWALPLFEIEHPEVAAGLASALSQSNLRAAISGYFKRFPLLAPEALAPVAKGKSKSAPLAQALLDSLSALNPAKPKANSNVQVGTSSTAIPAWLGSPAWREKRKKAKAAVIDGLSLAGPEALHLPDPMPAAGFSAPPQIVPDRWSTFTQSLRSGMPLDPSLLDGLSDEHLKIVFQRADPAQWPTGVSYVPLLVRLGLECLEALEMLAYQDLSECLRLLQHIESPKAAGIAAAGLAGSPYRRMLALNWLRSYPEAAAAGLIPRAFGPLGEERSEAESALRQVPQEIVKRVAAGTPAQSLVEEFCHQDPLELFPAKIPKIPDFCASLPAILDKDGAPVAATITQTVLEMLAFSSDQAPYIGLELCRQSLSEQSLEEFSWQLLLGWLLAGAPSKEKWAAYSLVHFGGERSARRLAQLMPKESVLIRSDLGLDVLYQMSTPVAFFQLSLLAQSTRPLKGLQARAEQYLQEYAKIQQWDARQLLDHCTPDFGLDRAGEAQLELDGESHLAYLSSDLEFQLSNPQKPAMKLQKEAQAWLKCSNTDLKAFLAVQTRRLEEAMIAGLRWSLQEFQTLFVAHPVLSRYCDQLVWGQYMDEKLAKLFLLSEGAPDEGMIGIPHPLEISDSQRTLWNGKTLGPPFKQLGRPLADSPSIGAIRAIWTEHCIYASDLNPLLARGWRAEASPDSDTRDRLVRRYAETIEVRLELLPGLSYGEEHNSLEQELGRIELLACSGLMLDWQQYPVLLSEIDLELKAFLKGLSVPAA
jgi:hypothetical protein